MWIVIENGEVFDGDLLQLDDDFDLFGLREDNILFNKINNGTLEFDELNRIKDEIIAFCKGENWNVVFYDDEALSLN